MPKLDACHYQIVRSLQKEGWQVIHNSLHIDDDFDNTVYIDIQAVKAGNDMSPRSILVEAKCFGVPRQTADLHRALGQYIVYRGILDAEGFSDPLYLAVPAKSLADYFNSRILQIVQQHAIRLVVIDLEEERVVQWIE